jgi:hypothetical protein
MYPVMRNADDVAVHDLLGSSVLDDVDDVVGNALRSVWLNFEGMRGLSITQQVWQKYAVAERLEVVVLVAPELPCTLLVRLLMDS